MEPQVVQQQREATRLQSSGPMSSAFVHQGRIKAEDLKRQSDAVTSAAIAQLLANWGCAERPSPE